MKQVDRSCHSLAIEWVMDQPKSCQTTARTQELAEAIQTAIEDTVEEWRLYDEREPDPDTAFESRRLTIQGGR